MAQYYVSPSGSDSNDGLSTGAPWLTVSKVNGTTLSAGDIVSFRRGGVWAEMLQVGQNGSSGNPIRVNAYGTKTARPMFKGATRGIYVAGRSWHEYLDLQCRNATGDGGAYVDGTSSNILFQNCDASYGQLQGFMIVGDSVTLRRCSGRFNGQIGSDPTNYHGVYLGAFGGAEANNYVVEDCTFTNNPGGGIHAFLAGSGSIRRNHCHSNGTWGVIVSNPIASASIDVDNVLSHGNTYGLEIEGIDAGQLVRVRHTTLAGNTTSQLRMDSNTGTDVAEVQNCILDATGMTYAVTFSDSALELTNSIVWRGDAGELANIGGTDYTLAEFYTLLGGNPVPVSNITGSDPLLDASYQIALASPARNKGPDLSLATDRLGVPRPQKGSVDWGCHERRTFVLRA